jgi:hypothetical protein
MKSAILFVEGGIQVSRDGWLTQVSWRSGSEPRIPDAANPWRSVLEEPTANRMGKGMFMTTQ